MSIIGSNILAGASGQGGGYTIERSLRLRSSASAYLSRTPASAGNRKTWTWSGWVKRGTLSSLQFLFQQGADQNNASSFQFNSGDTLEYNHADGGTNTDQCVTSAVFRDTSAWYHIVLSVDTTQATDTNRIKIYVNGTLQSLGTANYPAQNVDTDINTATPFRIGSQVAGTPYYFDGYLTEVNFIDGQALTPSDFGEYNADTGVWQPAKYAGSYGTNGFYLPFSDNTTTTTLAEDASGNGNDWTPNNISLTSGATYDSMTDTPTPYADGGNYAVLNPLNVGGGTISNGNLQWAVSSGTGLICTATIGFDIADTTNKYYWEMTLSSGEAVYGIAPLTLRGSDTNRAGSYGYYVNGNKYFGTTGSSYGASFTSGDVIGVAVGAGKITFYKNGVSQGDAFTGLTGTFVPFIAEVSTTTIANFGQRPFAYTPPTGFLPLHTGNLPDSAIVDGSQYFDVVTRTGTGAEATVTGLQFQPDLLWTKTRSNAVNHSLTSTGLTYNYSFLQTNTTEPENTSASQYYMIPTADGYTVGTGDNINQVSRTFVDWVWKANGAGVSNTDGSITSTVSANPTSGFSIVTWTGTGANGTIGHGLGVAPQMMIVKDRNNSYNWYVFFNATGTNLRFEGLNTTSAATTQTDPNQFVPTSSVIAIPNFASQNTSGAGMLCYAFAPVSGFSKFGSYTGNGNSDGPFVYLGFRPKFIMIKGSSFVSNWFIEDGVRNGYNVNSGVALRPNLSNAEDGTTFYDIDILSNGFKLRTSTGDSNSNGATFIFAAFAESPFKTSLAR